jgi:hypothetical protein
MIRLASRRPGGSPPAAAATTRQAENAMHTTRFVAALAAVLAGAMAIPALAQQKGMAHKPPTTDKEMIANALSAAPRAVARDATVMAMDDKGQMRVLRQGKGEFTCLPDIPHTPGNDPMCADRNAMAWVEAWLGKKPPAADRIGIVYMLKGGSDASNDDPYATKPAPGHKWIDTGPHIMVVGGARMLGGYPKSAANPRSPYIMFPGTPYEHIMIPVR